MGGLIDHPDNRKRHLHTIPLSGGVAAFGTILLGTVLLHIPLYSSGVLLVACCVFALGLFDDLRDARSSLRLFLHYGAGLALAAYAGIVIYSVGDLLAMGDIPLSLLAIPLTALSVAGLCNAFNMVDGIDGLCASLMLIPLILLSILAVASNHSMLDSLMLLIIPLIVFLPFNLGPNTRLLPKIFLGDSGSTTLGLLVTASLVYFSQGDSALINPVTALWLAAIPLMDMLATMARRYRLGRPLMKADRSHLHYSLIDLGLTARGSLVVIVIYAACCAVIGLLLEGLPEYVSMFSFLGLFLLHLAFTAAISQSPEKRSRMNE
jgi:UDP-GlcNAc:undecaprenyl-phosphate GlcNAc-1-phosphate transferase